MFADFVTNILFPPTCIACRHRIARGVVCDACFATIDLNPALMCGECHAWLAPPATPSAKFGAAGKSATAAFASPCHPDFPFVLGGAGRYDNPVLQSLIHHLKFRSLTAAAEPLSDLLVRYAERMGVVSGSGDGDTSFISTAAADFAVIPIPLSRRRRRSRGYNQAELIARRFAAELSLPLDTTTLVRARHAKPQSDIANIAERRENIRGVFAIANNFRGASTGCNLHTKNIILIDDVSTTGSTFYEAARVLQSAGAQHIIALAVAKTM
jgi:ComF family protein